MTDMPDAGQAEPAPRPVPILELATRLISMRGLDAIDPLVLEDRLRRWARVHDLDYDELPSRDRRLLYIGFVARGEEERVMGNVAAQFTSERDRRSA